MPKAYLLDLPSTVGLVVAAGAGQPRWVRACRRSCLCQCAGAGGRADFHRTSKAHDTIAITCTHADLFSPLVVPCLPLLHQLLQSGRVGGPPPAPTLPPTPSTGTAGSLVVANLDLPAVVRQLFGAPHEESNAFGSQDTLPHDTVRMLLSYPQGVVLHKPRGEQVGCGSALSAQANSTLGTENSSSPLQESRATPSQLSTDHRTSGTSAVVPASRCVVTTTAAPSVPSPPAHATDDASRDEAWAEASRVTERHETRGSNRAQRGQRTHNWSRNAAAGGTSGSEEKDGGFRPADVRNGGLAAADVAVTFGVDQGQAIGSCTDMNDQESIRQTKRRRRNRGPAVALARNASSNSVDQDGGSDVLLALL